jgi:uncharacterized protein
MTENAHFKTQEVSWTVDGIHAYGTYTEPNNADSCPAVVFVAGSGPTDRDWCSPLLPGKNGSAKLLAETLAGQGFVTLRYDKFASGPHVRENITKLIGKISMQSHVKELTGAVETVIAQKTVNKDTLFVLTNSEGAIHAVNYQLETKGNRFKGLLLTGAPGRAVGDVARSQILSQTSQLPNAQNIMKHYDDAISKFQEGKPMVLDASLPDTIKMLLQSLQSPMNLPFSRELWVYSLPERVAKIAEPILVLIGKKDIQVDWQSDGKLLEAAKVSSNNATFAYPENANHVLKYEETTRERLVAADVGLRYNAQDAVLDQEALKAILTWLSKHALPDSEWL